MKTVLKVVLMLTLMMAALTATVQAAPAEPQVETDPICAPQTTATDELLAGGSVLHDLEDGGCHIFGRMVQCAWLCRPFGNPNCTWEPVYCFHGPHCNG